MDIHNIESNVLIEHYRQRYNICIVSLWRFATFKEYYSDNEHATKLLCFAFRKPKHNHINL
jgi:hypothetical protein